MRLRALAWPLACTSGLLLLSLPCTVAVHEEEDGRHAQLKLPGRVAVAGGAGGDSANAKTTHDYAKEFADLFAKGKPPPVRPAHHADGSASAAEGRREL
mmetsp:Transcript_49994/g.100672  ORF Transcript_49994/g.100672 Transcript_49994/m.100672 type:complete len:99 (+) Transcript_49994:65-361(+)